MKFQTKMFNVAKQFTYTPVLGNMLKYCGYDVTKIGEPIKLEMITDSNHYEDEYDVRGFAYTIKSKERNSTVLKLVFVITEDNVPDFEIERMLYMAFHNSCPHTHDCCGCRQDRVKQTRNLGNGFWLVRTYFFYNN